MGAKYTPKVAPFLAARSLQLQRQYANQPSQPEVAKEELIDQTQQDTPVETAPVETPQASSATELPRDEPNTMKDKLAVLADMGYTDEEANINLLIKHKGDLYRAIHELLRPIAV